MCLLWAFPINSLYSSSFVTGFFHLMSSRVIGVNSMCQNCVLFYGQEIFHCMHIDHILFIRASDGGHGGSFLFISGGAGRRLMSLWTFVYKFSCYIFSLLRGIYLGVELLGYMVTLNWVFWGSATLVSRTAAPLHAHQHVGEFQFFYVLIRTCHYLYVFYYGH